MNKYDINWFKFTGLSMLSIMLQVHFNISIGFLINLLIVVSLGLISIEKGGE